MPPTDPKAKALADGINETGFEPGSTTVCICAKFKQFTLKDGLYSEDRLRSWESIEKLDVYVFITQSLRRIFEAKKSGLRAASKTSERGVAIHLSPIRFELGERNISAALKKTCRDCKTLQNLSR